MGRSVTVAQRENRCVLYVGKFATLCRLGFRPFTRKSGARTEPVGIGIGRPKGHAWITPGPPKRHAWVTHGSIGISSFVCNKAEKKGVGQANRRESPRAERQNLPRRHRGTETSQIE